VIESLPTLYIHHVLPLDINIVITALSLFVNIIHHIFDTINTINIITLGLFIATAPVGAARRAAGGVVYAEGSGVVFFNGV
jgi:hypothetical protein